MDTEAACEITKVSQVTLEHFIMTNIRNVWFLTIASFPFNLMHLWLI